MFFFRHPKPVVDRRPVAEQSVQVKAATLPALTELAESRRSPLADEQTQSPVPIDRAQP